MFTVLNMCTAPFDFKSTISPDGSLGTRSSSSILKIHFTILPLLFTMSRIQNLYQSAYLLPKLILLAILSFNSFSWCDVNRPDKSWVLRSIKCSINFSNWANLVSSRLTNKRWRISSHSSKTEHISSAIGSAADAKLLRSLGNVFWKLKARTGQWAPLF